MSQRSASAGFDAVVFDLDGTLADTADDIHRALVRACMDMGREMGASVRHLVDGSPLEEIFAVVFPDGTAADLVRFVSAYRGHYEAEGESTATLFPGVRETLATLGTLSPRVPLAVATAKRGESARRVLDALGVSGHFDVIAGSGATDLRPKPAPDLLLHVADRLAIAPHRALMVGDTLRDIEAARRAGMPVAAATWGLGAADALMAARPDYVLEDFEEILALLGIDA